MSVFTSTAFFNIQPASVAGPTFQFRNDPYSASLLIAMPMSQFSTLGMTSYRQDVSANIRGTGSNISLVPTGSVYASGSTATYSTASWSSQGYTTSGAIIRGASGAMFGAPTTTTVNFASSNFVIECYLLIPNIGEVFNSTVFGQNSGDYLLADLSTNGNSVRFYIGGSGGPVSNTWSANTWYHVAYVRSGNNYYSYVNGTRKNNFSRAGAVPNSPDGFWRLLGNAGNVNDSVSKTVQDFRLYIGTDKGYTGATIVPPPSIVQQVS
jgi:hypothetical protein